MASWYVQRGSEVLGPARWEELQQKADEGELAPQDQVREGTDGPWVPASEVDGLFLAPSGSITAIALEEPGAEAADGEKIRTSPGAAADTAREMARSPLALRPCGDCGRMVSHHAGACPNCGRSFRDASATIPYQGEHPVPVWVFFTLVALAFVLASPMVVYRVAAHAAANAMVDGAAAGAISLLVAAAYSLSMICCALLGGAVGTPRMAYYTGLLLGLFFGPLGVFAAFAIDKRPQCPNCLSRLGGLARECPYCHARLTWAKEVRWY